MGQKHFDFQSLSPATPNLQFLLVCSVYIIEIKIKGSLVKLFSFLLDMAKSGPVGLTGVLGNHTTPK